MKRATSHLFCLLTVAAYVFAYMGFGIHTCHEDGSRHFVWLYGDVSCESIHHHSHDADHDHHHDDHCCSTHVYVLTDAQDNVPDDGRITAPEILLPLLSETAPATPVLAAHHEIIAWDSPPPVTVPVRALLSVWLV